MTAPAPSGAAPQRWVLHLDMDSFFASVEQLTRPTLRGRPVLVGGAGARGVVAGASYEARHYGARSAMPMHQARRLVGVRAVIVPARGAVYSAASARVFAALREMLPVLEQLSLDEAFGEPDELIGAGPDRVAAFCTRLRDHVRERTGLEASVGAGSGKQVAKIASDLAKPAGQRVITRAQEPIEIAPLPVRRLWGVGPVTEQRLIAIGVETIADLAALDRTEVTSLLGTAVGAQLWALARGVDDRPVAERAEAKQVSSETTFAHDLLTRGQIKSALAETAASAHRRLLRDGRAARTVVAKFRKADMAVLTRSTTLPYATADLTVLTAAAHKVAVDPAQVGPIRLVGVGYSGLSEQRQTVLFPDLDLTAARLSPASIAGAETDADVFDHASDDAEAVEDVGDGDDDAAAAGAMPAEAGQRARYPVGGHSDDWTPSAGADVVHSVHGHGWVQGAGHGVVTVRFETRTTGPGPARTFASGDPQLRPADPLASLDWGPEPGDLGPTKPADPAAGLA